MADKDFIRLNEPEAHKLADMKGVLIDLRMVSGLCHKLKRMLDSAPGTDTLDLEAFQTAALIRYGRCFKGGRRNAFLLDLSFIQQLPARLRGTHRAAIALRDKHIAHSINDWELNEPVAQVRFEKGKIPEVVAVQVNHHHVIASASDWLTSLATLASTLADHVELLFEEERQRVLAVAKTIPVHEMLRRRRAPARFPGQQRDLAKPRGRK